ncbi:MAG: hypothetical protein LIP03_01785 [Bacteroidales bacterium]|nr:hypothetical protein [Bacteroidales bacterium]
MKKLVYLVAVAFAASLVACGNKEKAQEAAVEEAPAAEIVEENAAVELDSLNADSTLVVGEEDVVAE